MSSEKNRRIVISSGQVNSYGYRVLPEGIDYSDYLNNPIILVHHEDEVLSIGKMNDIQLVDGKLTGVPEFDLDDPIGADVDRKYKKGYINACSMYHEPIEVSNDPALVFEGQTRSTVVSTSLMEISMANLPSDRGAHKLSKETATSEVLLIPKLNYQKQIKMSTLSSELLGSLGLSEGSSEAEAITAINNMKTKLAAQKSEQIETLLSHGKSKGLINDDNEEIYKKLAAKDYDSTKDLIESHVKEDDSSETDTVFKKLSNLLKKTGKEVGENEETFDSLSKNNPNKLNRIRQEEPERYKALVKAHTKG